MTDTEKKPLNIMNTATWYCVLAQWVTIPLGVLKPCSVPGIALGLLMPFREMWYKYLVNVKPSGTAFP